MRTLLTGGTGYIGLHIVRELLSDGQDVTAVVRSPERLLDFVSHPRLNVVKADLEDDTWFESTFPGHDVFVHAALVWGSINSEIEGLDAAITSKLFNAAGVSGLKRGIFLSSTAVHRPFSGVMSEEDCVSAVDLYSANKASGELFLRAACASHKMTGIVVRPGPVVGLPACYSGPLRTPSNIMAMIDSAVRGEPIEVIRGDGRQFVDVSTLAKVIRVLTRKSSPEPTYICADSKIITWYSIAEFIESYIGSPGGVNVLKGENYRVPPRFSTKNIEELIGFCIDSEKSLHDHIRNVISIRKTAG